MSILYTKPSSYLSRKIWPLKKRTCFWLPTKTNKSHEILISSSYSLFISTTGSRPEIFVEVLAEVSRSPALLLSKKTSPLPSRGSYCSWIQTRPESAQPNQPRPSLNECLLLSLFCPVSLSKIL